jgi:hypothetical protein
VFFLPEDGGYCEGQQGYELVLSGSQPGVSYELFLNGTFTGNIRPGNGSALSFGFLSALGEYTVLATNTDCTLPMSGSTTVYYLPGPEAAGTPVGPSETCNSQPGQYTTGGAANAAFYIWHIDPPTAGTFSGDGETVTVTWDPGFSGTATISVQGATECAQGQMSPAFNVTVILAPTPAVTGQTEPCTEQSNKVYTYTTELNLQNDYSWLVQGGQFVSGQGSNRALVKWTNPGSGRIILSESSPNGCTTIDTLEVQIFDCTGIGENQSGRLEIFPNPVEDVLTIRAEIKETGTATIFIYNNSGQQVIRQETKPDNGRIDVTIPTRSIKFGVYGIKLITEKGQILESKFLKSK